MQADQTDHEVLETEIEMLSSMIAEMTAKVEEAQANLRKLSVVRAALQTQVGEPQLDLELNE
jgi:uncharacterized coiled-coil protein SlyX|tara:strand:- start:909 stop:1094 length:186 start_codon:yes stop_codon:yes gene_type:complete